MKKYLSLLIVLTNTFYLCNASIWYVATNGNDSNSGSENLPFISIQKGINSANTADTVLVYPGTYIENINFNGKNIVVSSKYIITQDTAFITSTTIDGNNSGAVVKFNNNETSRPKLIGFTLTNGYGDEGGGIACSNASPRLSHLIVKNNEAFMSGGGINLMTSNSYLSEIIIDNNLGSDGGGGIYIYMEHR